jgi:hypothetical protein
MPRGIPINIQNITAVNIIAKVVMASDHKSTRSIKIKLNKVKTVNLIPLVLKAKYKKIKITIGNGIKLNKVSKPFKTLSIGADNFLKSGLCVKSHSLIFFSIHSDIGMYISKSEGANFKLTLDYFNQLSKVL